MSERKSISVDISSPAFVLFAIFLVLKLTQTIDWSWLWVTAPLWLGFALVLAILGVIGCVMLLVALADAISNWRRASRRAAQRKKAAGW